MLLTPAHEGHARLLGDAHPGDAARLDRSHGRRAARPTSSPTACATCCRGSSRTSSRCGRSTGLSPKSRRTLFERYVEGYRHYALASLRGGSADRAFELAELSKARTLLEGMALQQANRSGRAAGRCLARSDHRCMKESSRRWTTTSTRPQKKGRPTGSQQLESEAQHRRACLCRPASTSAQAISESTANWPSRRRPRWPMRAAC